MLQCEGAGQKIMINSVYGVEILCLHVQKVAHFISRLKGFLRFIQAELLPRATEVYLTRPDGGVSSLPFTAEGVAFRAEAPGVYTLLQNRPGEDAARFVDFSVRIPPGESAVSPKAEERPLSLSRDPDMADGLTAPADADDGLLDIKYYLAGALLLLLALEWGMYHREQY